MLLKAKRVAYSWNMFVSSQSFSLFTRNLWNASSVQGTVLGFIWTILDLTNVPQGLYLNGCLQEDKAEVKPIYPFFVEQLDRIVAQKEFVSLQSSYELSLLNAFWTNSDNRKICPINYRQVTIHSLYTVW